MTFGRRSERLIQAPTTIAKLKPLAGDEDSLGVGGSAVKQLHRAGGQAIGDLEMKGDFLPELLGRRREVARREGRTQNAERRMKKEQGGSRRRRAPDRFSDILHSAFYLMPSTFCVLHSA